MGEALYETAMLREFAGLEIDQERLPDESTILRFRNLLKAYQLSVQILATVKATLTVIDFLLKQGTMVDPTLIAAPSSTKNSKGTRDPEMHQTKKGNHWHGSISRRFQVVRPQLDLRDPLSKMLRSVVAPTVCIFDRVCEVRLDGQWIKVQLVNERGGTAAKSVKHPAITRLMTSNQLLVLQLFERINHCGQLHDDFD